MSEEGSGRGGGMTFAMQIGLVRESVTVEGGELTMATLTDIACAFVDRKVSTLTLILVVVPYFLVVCAHSQTML